MSNIILPNSSRSLSSAPSTPSKCTLIAFSIGSVAAAALIAVSIASVLHATHLFRLPPALKNVSFLLTQIGDTKGFWAPVLIGGGGAALGGILVSYGVFKKVNKSEKKSLEGRIHFNLDTNVYRDSAVPLLSKLFSIKYDHIIFHLILKYGHQPYTEIYKKLSNLTGSVLIVVCSRHKTVDIKAEVILETLKIGDYGPLTKQFYDQVKPKIIALPFNEAQKLLLYNESIPERLAEELKA